MQNVKIRFAADHVKQDDRAGTSRATIYAKGSEYSVSEGTARHYVKRGLAEYVMPAMEGPGGNEPLQAIVIPDAWKQLPKKELLALASRLHPTPIKDLAKASEVIDTELQRRAATAPPPAQDPPPPA